VELPPRTVRALAPRSQPPTEQRFVVRLRSASAVNPHPDPRMARRSLAIRGETKPLGETRTRTGDTTIFRRAVPAFRWHEIPGRQAVLSRGLSRRKFAICALLRSNAPTRSTRTPTAASGPRSCSAAGPKSAVQPGSGRSGAGVKPLKRPEKADGAVGPVAACEAVLRELQALQAFLLWRDPDSNRGHHDFQSCALPTELSRRAGEG
jgi:hypothetical protein